MSDIEEYDSVVKLTRVNSSLLYLRTNSRVMKKRCLSLLACTIAAGLLSCSSGTQHEAEHDTAASADTVANAPVLTPFEPDANWTTPTEVISQYGPSGIIRDVVIDHNGIIWMAAWDGVVSYDGKQFTNHTLKDGLSHHRVYSVMEDSKGNIWFGTMGAGAYKYDGTKFTNLSTNNGMVHNVVFDLFEDANGNIWFATTKGVSMYDPDASAGTSGKAFTNLDSADGLPREIYAISQDIYRTMWFGGEAGLFQYSPSKAYSNVTEILTEQGTHYANVRDICWSNGTMYFGGARGLYVSKPLDHVPLKITLVNDKFTGYVCSDNSGDLLLTSDGIFRYHVLAQSASDADYNRYTAIVEDKSSLGIFGACEAKDGTIWYGAMDGLHSVKDGKDVSYKKP